MASHKLSWFRTFLVLASAASLFMLGAPSHAIEVSGIKLEPGANLQGVSLKGLLLNNRDLSGANLSGANLESTRLGSSNLENANLSNARMKWTVLIEANLKGANLKGANLYLASLRSADITGANLDNAALAGADLKGIKSGSLTGSPASLSPPWQLVNGYLLGEGADLQNANLSGASLQGADLREANLGAANFSGANLTGVNLNGANIEGANLSGVDLSFARTCGVQGVPASIPPSFKLIGTCLVGPGAVLDWTTTLMGADLSGTNLEGVSLANVNLTGVKSGGIEGKPRALPTPWQLINGYLIGPGADLAASKLQGVKLAGANLKGTIFAGANLTGANLTNANLDLADFTGANLEGANLSGARLVETDFSGAKLALTNLERTNFNSFWTWVNDILVRKFLVSSTPVVRGTIEVGQTVTADVGDGWEDGATFEYQWLRNGVPVSGERNATYLLGSEDFGTQIAYEVSVSKIGYATDTRRASARAVAAGTLTFTPTPLVSGIFKVGQTLTVTLGTWDDGVTHAFQWVRERSDVLGATDLNFDIGVEDLGKELSVVVTSSKPGYKNKISYTTPTSVGVASLSLSPAPNISGNFKVGQTLTVTPGTWDTGVALNYQWSRDGLSITSATTTTYTLTTEDFGKQISVEVTGAKTGYETVKKTSTAVKVEAGTQTLAPTPTISGTNKVGQTLTVTQGTWDSGVTLAYQWLRDGVAINGATSASYALAPSDFGRNVGVEVTATKTGYETVKKTSTAVKVEPGTQTLAPTPTISGTNKVGQTLTVTQGTWDSGVTLAYQWLRDGVAINGATSASYALAPNDFGRNVGVEVTGTLAGYATVSKASAQVKVAAGLMTITTPKVSGTAKSGNTLKATTSAWVKGSKISYQWLSNGSVIKGATSSSLKISSTLKGKKISVKVTQSAAGYTTATKTSNALTVSK